MISTFLWIIPCRDRGQMSLPVREDLKSGAPCWFQCSSAPKPGTRGRGGEAANRLNMQSRTIYI